MAREARHHYTPTPAERAARVLASGTWADEVETIHYVAYVTRAVHFDIGEDTPEIYFAEIIDPPLTEVGNVEPNLKGMGRSPERALYFLGKRIAVRTGKPSQARDVLYDDSVQVTRRGRGKRQPARLRLGRVLHANEPTPV